MITPELVFHVILYISGKKMTYYLDDYFGYDEKESKWQFSFSEPNEIWVMLLEKAWAKACGSYARTIGGITEEGLRALTGAPVESILHSEIGLDQIWRVV
jgi:hypothetical protein